MLDGKNGLSFVIFSTILLLLCSTPANGQGECTKSNIFTEKTCRGDTDSVDERLLVEIVNKFRAANGAPTLRISPSLSMLANRRMLDLKNNLKTLTHSWSNCSYNLSDEKSWPCVTDAPKRLNSGYKGQGYETLYRTSTGNAVPAMAVDAWGKSTLHSSIILNQGIFRNMAWDEVGVAIDGQYAALWFGYPGSGRSPVSERVMGLGVSYDQAVAGLSSMLSIDQKSTTVDNNTWRGFSPDKKLKLEIYGTNKEISEADLAITLKLEQNQDLDIKNKLVITTFLTNLFPEWNGIDAWIDNAAKAIAADRSSSRTKRVRKIAVDLKSGGPGALKLSVKPQSKPVYVEVF